MKKRTAALWMAVLFAISGMTGCSSAKEAVNSGEAAEGIQADADKRAADHVAALIDEIYVQTRNENIDAQCSAAKEAWDALTDAQKALVEGEFADPDYFGKDTGEAAKDDPRNQDGIGENEILAVSFGTSFNDSRVADIKGIEDALQTAYPEWSVRRAFTSQIIINHVQARDGERIDNMDQALERAVSGGVKNLVIQPTHLMRGTEYDEMMRAVENWREQFESVLVAEPLLGRVGTDAAVVNTDKKKVAEAVMEAAVKEAGYDSLTAAKEEKTAFIFLGHGTSHTAKVSYSQMQTQMTELGYDNAFVGTVEGEPEETACGAVIEAVSEAGYKKVVLRPLMVVAGDHANHDMAGEEEDSWLSMFQASGQFEKVEAQMDGLGRIEAIQQLYVTHAADAMGQKAGQQEALPDSVSMGKILPDGVYTAEFHTDSTMFRANEACDGKGTLTVADGSMTFHVSLASKNIIHLYPGIAEEAEKEGAKLLEPTEDTVTYSDGLTETVHGFDIPVPALGEEFDLALIGKKGIWYDHKVSVSNPQSAAKEENAGEADWKNGCYSAALRFEGGSGKAQVLPETELTVRDGSVTARIQWNSPNYDYMIVDGEKYFPVNTEGNSVFEIPVRVFDEPVEVIGNTVAMSKPHEIEYTLTFLADTLKRKE